MSGVDLNAGKDVSAGGDAICRHCARKMQNVQWVEHELDLALDCRRERPANKVAFRPSIGNEHWFRYRQAGQNVV